MAGLGSAFPSETEHVICKAACASQPLGERRSAEVNN